MKNIFQFVLLLSVAFAMLFSSCKNPKTLNEVESKFVTQSDSVTLHYKVYGKGNDVVVFVHGFGCDVNAWQGQFDFFKDKVKMILIDLPGFGLSSQPKTAYTLDLFADAVKTVIETEKVENVILVGHSLGTPVCRQVVFKYTDLVSKMVDVDGVYCFYPADSMMLMAYNSLKEGFKGDRIKQTFNDFIQPLFVSQTPENVQNYAMTIMPQTLEFVAYSTMENLIDEKYWTSEQISIPALVVAAKSSQIPPDYEQMMRALYTNIQYCELDGIGHFIMMEQPDMFNRLMYDFIKK